MFKKNSSNEKIDEDRELTRIKNINISSTDEGQWELTVSRAYPDDNFVPFDLQEKGSQFFSKVLKTEEVLEVAKKIISEQSPILKYIEETDRIMKDLRDARLEEISEEVEKLLKEKKDLENF